MRRLPSLLIAMTMLSGLAAAPTTTPPTGSIPRYDHIFVIVEENHGLNDLIGNPAAPNLNALAQQFGFATTYFGVTHPSEPNYVAILAASSATKS